MIIGRNASRNKKILIDRLIHGFKYDELSEKYELTCRQLQNIVKKWERIVSE